MGPSGWWSYSLGPTIGSGLCIHGSALKVILLSFTVIGLIFIYLLHTFLALFSTMSIDKSTQQRKSKRKGNEEKRKELRYKTCGWNLTFVFIHSKVWDGENLFRSTCRAILLYVPGCIPLNQYPEALIQSHADNLISLTSSVFPWP